MTRLRIAHVCLSDKWNGSEVVAAEYANSSARDHDVGMIFREGDSLSHDFYRQRLDSRVQFAFVADAKAPAELKSAARALFNGDMPDIFHAHLGPGCRAIISAFPDSIKIGHMHMRFFTNQHAKLDGVIAIAPWQLRDIPKHFAGKAWLAPNFLQESEIKPAAEMRSRLQNMLHLSSDAKLVGTVGRLHSDKGIDVLIEAQRVLNDKNIQLLVFGEGPEEIFLRARAKDLGNVRFLGYRRDVRHLVAGLDLFVSASRSEPFGLATLEAMAAGVSVVATRTRGSKGLLEHLQDRLFAIEDIHGTAAIIKKFCRLGDVPDYRLERFDKQKSLAALNAAYSEAYEQFKQPNAA